eukprot:COSAG01_NODE_69891_length_260_cov_0.639752_1_plen_83_part_01
MERPLTELVLVLVLPLLVSLFSAWQPWLGPRLCTLCRLVVQPFQALQLEPPFRGHDFEAVPERWLAVELTSLHPTEIRCPRD